MIFTVLVAASTAVGLNAQNTQAVTPAQGQPTMQAQPGGRQMTPPSPEDRAKRMTEHLNQMLTLTPEQTKKVTDLYKETATKQDALRKEAQANNGAAGGAGNSGMGAKFKELNDNTDAKLKEILTADQYTKYLESRKARMNPGQRPGMPGAPTGAPATAPSNGGQH